MELAVFIGLLLALIRVVLPMTGWTVPPGVARAITVTSVALIVIVIAMILWRNSHDLLTPLATITAVIQAPEARQLFSLGSLLLVVLIALTVFQMRPLYRQVEEINKALERYVLPRHLTDDQITKIADYLSKHPPHKIKIRQPIHNEEASSYRCDFQSALTKGGWQIDGIDIDENAREGVSIELRQPNNATVPTPDPFELLRQAFRHAKVRINGASKGSGSNIQETTITLNVGKRRMDDGEIRSRREEIERLRTLEKNPEDFDI